MNEQSEIQVHAQTLLNDLAPLDNPVVLTPDELTCLRIMREACEDILKGGDISPPAEGTQKLRLSRRVNVGFFTHTAPRPITT
jgi:hypothetical protein